MLLFSMRFKLPSYHEVQDIEVILYSKCFTFLAVVCKTKEAICCWHLETHTQMKNHGLSKPNKQNDNWWSSRQHTHKALIIKQLTPIFFTCLFMFSEITDRS